MNTQYYNNSEADGLGMEMGIGDGDLGAGAWCSRVETVSGNEY